jgi:ATP-dependent exoDNAse (exonuclease V) beta subunit
LNLKCLQIEEWRLAKIVAFVDTVEDLSKNWSDYYDTPTKLVNGIIEHFSLLPFYHDESSRTSNIDDSSDEIILEIILSVASNFKSVQDFYAHIYQSINELHNEGNDDENETKNQIVLSSIHSSKGKEYKNVVYFNLATWKGKLLNESEIEEERRICYVGMTRAIENLYITAPIKNYSQFLKEILRNPNFNSLTDSQLGSLLSQERLNIQSIQSQIVSIKSEITRTYTEYPELTGREMKIDTNLRTISQKRELEYLFNKYPEIQGKDLKVTFPIFKDYFIKRKLERISSATARIEELRQQIESIKKDIGDERKRQVDSALTKINNLDQKTSSLESDDIRLCNEKVESINLEIEYRALLKP